MSDVPMIVLSWRDFERDAERDANMIVELSVELAERGCPGYDDPSYLEDVLTKAISGKGATVACLDGVLRVVYRDGRIELEALDKG